MFAILCINYRSPTHALLDTEGRRLSVYRVALMSMPNTVVLL